jgi:2-polyprenyl-6-methoxyphenol hydroxylase-like FAD-dependent oxidoreductase
MLVMASKIAIIGAGPAGLTFTSLLRASRQNFEITIFEKDASPVEHFRKGGTLDLHDYTGLAALRKVGLWDSFSKYARHEGQDMVFADKNANHVYEDVSKGELGRDSPGTRPEIDRGRLQDILLKGVPTGWIRWALT